MTTVPAEWAAKLPPGFTNKQFQRCPNCGSADGLQVNWPGRYGSVHLSVHCWSCNYRKVIGEGWTPPTPRPEVDEQALAKLARLRRDRPDLRHAAHPGRFDAWARRGVGEGTVRKFWLGLCPDGLTIPVYEDGALATVVIRLNKPEGGGKYRRMVAGLPHAPAWSNGVKAGVLWLVEGPIKGIVVSQWLDHEFPVIALHTQRMDSVAREQVDDFPLLWYVPDPCRRPQHLEIEAQNLLDLKAGGHTVRVIHLPDKVDDLINMQVPVFAQAEIEIGTRMAFQEGA